MFLAQNKEDVLCALGAKRKPAPATGKKPKAVADSDDEDESVDNAA